MESGTAPTALVPLPWGGVALADRPCGTAVYEDSSFGSVRSGRSCTMLVGRTLDTARERGR
jgi:hypothetical protein